ncbi:hypothetical protein L3Y34_013095 [Caenorhabditis briggsae]|nr:hypothetical protein L3Y34_013095 [Caenorhabditis briggsae]
MLERLKKDRMYEDCVLADVHASAIDEFRVKLDDNMNEAINKSVDSRQFMKLCETLYIEAYECMKKEIDYMFAAITFENAEARHRVWSFKDMVIKRCCVESHVFYDRYIDYWVDMCCAKKEGCEINDLDVDLRLMTMLGESKERVGKRNAERQAKLDFAEKLKRNFNCEDPKSFWKTSAQKELDQKSPAAVPPIMKKLNNLAHRPEVEGTIAEEVRNQYENHVREKMNAACSDAQNLNDGAPKKKNERTRKEDKTQVQSTQQGSSTQSTSRAERAQRLKTLRLRKEEKIRNYTSMQNLQRQRAEENAAAQSARTSNQSAQPSIENRESVRPPNLRGCSDVEELNVGASKTKKEESQKEVEAPVQSSQQGSGSQGSSRAQRARRPKSYLYLLELRSRRAEADDVARFACVSNQSAQPSIQNRESVRPPNLRGCSDVEKLNVGASKTKKEESQKEVKAPVQSSQQGSGSQGSSRAQRARRPKSYLYLLELRSRRAEADDVARFACVSNQSAQPSIQNQQSVRTSSHPKNETNILTKMMDKCSVSK